MRFTRLIGVLVLVVVGTCLWSTAAAWATGNGLMGWGNGEEGQFGPGTDGLRYTPQTMEKPTNVAAMASGQGFNLALLENGTVEGWGRNTEGQLGDGSTESVKNPVKVEGLSEVAAVAAGFGHGVALMKNGTVKTWGRNEGGQLCLGDTVNRTHPTETSAKEVIGIAAGFANTYLIKANHTLWGCGENTGGELGVGSMTLEAECNTPRGKHTPCATLPVEVPGLTEVTQVASNDIGSTVLAVLKNGTVKAWGENIAGQIGDGSTTARTSPVEVHNLEKQTVTSVSEGWDFSFALTSEGKLLTWGANGQGQLGVGATSEWCEEEKIEFECGRTPREVTGLSEKASAISAGEDHGLALLAGGQVESWGENWLAELGVGVSSPEECGKLPCSRVPVHVSAITQQPAVGVHGGNEDSFAIGPPGPIVSQLSPNNGPVTGGTKVIVKGHNFTGTPKVWFGETKAEATKLSESTIEATAPAGSGTPFVCVETESGSIKRSLPCKSYTYTSAPAAPEFGRCEESSEAGTKYSDDGCTTVSSKGKFVWNGGPGVTREFTLEDTATVTFESLGEKIEKGKKGEEGRFIYVTAISCEGAKGSGEYAGSKAVGGTELVFTGCEESYEGVPNGNKCQSRGAGTGEIASEPLQGVLGWISKVSKTVGIAFSSENAAPRFAHEWAREVECGGREMRIKGSVIARLTQLNEMLSSAKLTFQESNGTQSPGKLEEGSEKELLEMRSPEFGGAEEHAALGEWLRVGLKASVQQKNELSAKIEVNNKV